MELRKIVLLEPHKTKYQMYRLGLPLLGTLLKMQGYQVEILIGQKRNFPQQTLLEADLIGITTTTPTSIEAYRIAAHLKKIGKTVVIGGIHATLLPEEALRHADYVVRGEAEYSFPALVEAIRQGRLPEGIPGVSYWHNKKMRHNDSNKGWTDLNALPIPDFSLITNTQGRNTHYPVMSSRGCPYSCTFCSVTSMFGHSYRYRESELLLQEFSNNPGGTFFFCDENFAANKTRTKELLREMIDRKICPKWWKAQSRLEIAWDDELLELMRLSNAGDLYIGFESINKETLKELNKSHTVEDVMESVRRFHYYGLSIRGLFVFGADEDRKETIRETIDFVLEAKIDSIVFSVLTPLPGSSLFKQMEAEGRLLTKNWELYDCFNVVFQPNKMSPEELKEETVKAREKFYAHPPLAL